MNQTNAPSFRQSVFSGRMLFVSFTSLVCFLAGVSDSLNVVFGDGPYNQTVPVVSEYSAGFESITEAESETLLRHLVEGEMQGRGTGQIGYLHAARWYAEQLAGSGFQPAGDNGSWFQNVPFIKLTTDPDHSSFSAGEKKCIDFESLGIGDFAGEFQGTLPVTFAQVQDVTGRLLPGSCEGRLLVVQSSGRVAWNHESILAAKPECLLVVSDDGRVRNEAVSQSEQTPATYPMAMVTRSAADRLAEACGLRADFFTAASPDESLIVESSRLINADLRVEREAIDVPNVIGWFPGTDEAVNHEHICVGAHLDHLGVQRGQVYPGADDNGSGSTALLQIAGAIHSNPVKPRRSVLAIGFCAEERGLLGSKHYVRNPLRPLEDMICMLNIDMIGRNEETPGEPASENETTIHLVGSRIHSQEFHHLILDSNLSVGFDFEYDEETRIANRSDHASFAAKGIPVSFLFGGFSPYYHQTTDTLEGINFSKIANAARLNYLFLMRASEHGRFRPDSTEVSR